MGNTIEVRVPDIGDFDDVPIIEVLVAVGDEVAADDTLITLESEKATLDVPSPEAGRVTAINVALGDTVNEGSLILTLETAEGAHETQNAADVAAKTPAQPAPPVQTAEPTAGATTDAPPSTLEVRVPDIGDFSDVPVIEVLVAVGDEVAADDTLITLESEKATLDVPSPKAGRVAAISVSLGDTVNEGSLILTLEASGTGAATGANATTANTSQSVAPAAQTAERPSAPAAAPQSEPAQQKKPTPPATAAASTPAPSQPAPQQGLPAYASPSVRQHARNLGVIIGEVKGSGAKGRITKDDVEAFVKARMTKPQPQAGGEGFPGLPKWPNVNFAKFGPIERQPLTRIARISGPALTRNAMVIPHVTNFDKADITDVEDLRKTLNRIAGPNDAKITILAFAVKAVVAALKEYPKFNSSLDGDDLIIKQYWHIGVAADTPEGLVVPVVRDADKKSVRDIAAEMVELAASARAGKLKPAEMQGATFTISSLGGIGGTNFTPIINAPEVAILGMTRAETQPVWDGETFQPRLVQPLSVSWDHRVVDGVAAGRFLRHVAETLSTFPQEAI